MLRQNSRIIHLFLLLCDLFLMAAAFFAAWWIKFESPFFPPEAHLPQSDYFKVLYIALGIFLILQYFMQLYRSRRAMAFQKEFLELFKCTVWLFIIIMTVLFLFKMMDVSRVFILIFCVADFLLMAFERACLRAVSRYCRKKGFNIKYVVVVSLTGHGKSYIDAIKKHPETGYHIFGVLDDAAAVGETYHNISVLGDLSHLDDVLAHNLIDEVVIALPLNQYRRMSGLLACCEKYGVKSVIVPSYTDYIPANPEIDRIDHVPLINTRYIPLDNLANAFLKRATDLIISTALLILLSPLFLFCYIGIRCNSKGAVIFRQTRVGFNRKTFTMYKFRTMREDAQSDGWTVENDPRRTAFGAFLRKTNLDELPQLINVLKGEMSLVGPRPEQVGFVEQFKDEIPKYMIKHRVRPGMTGWAQVNGWRGDTSIEERIKCDIFYIENWNYFWDLKILLKTLGFGRKNAY